MPQLRIPYLDVGSNSLNLERSVAYRIVRMPTQLITSSNIDMQAVRHAGHVNLQKISKSLRTLSKRSTKIYYIANTVWPSAGNVYLNPVDSPFHTSKL